MTSRFPKALWLILILGCCYAGACAAQVADESPENPMESGPDVDEFDAESELDLDEPEIDVQSSIDDAEEGRRFKIDGDLRLGQVLSGDDFEDLDFKDSTVFRARWRIKSVLGISDRVRAAVRLSGICSSEDCSPDPILQPEIPTTASIEDGQITLDTLLLHWFRNETFNLAVGRMETKFVARGGVFSKSLDRNDSNNLRVNWTDGLIINRKARNDWETHLVLQHNSKNGPSNVRRKPLDFGNSGSRVSYFFGVENLQPKRWLVQRALDVSYLPSSLLVDGEPGGRVEDYWAVVARAAGRWPIRSDGWRLRIASEVGYAANTPTTRAAGIVGDGNTDGLAWNIAASIMDFRPNHSIGINFANTEAGWLISPQYADNEELFEIRYMWRPTDRLTLDVRGRWRDDLSPQIVEDPDRDRFDFFARITWSFKLLDQ